MLKSIINRITDIFLEADQKDLLNFKNEPNTEYYENCKDDEGNLNLFYGVEMTEEEEALRD